MNKEKIIEKFKLLSKEQLTEKFSFFSITGNLMMMNIILDEKILKKSIKLENKEQLIDKMMRNDQIDAFKLLEEKLLNVKSNKNIDILLTMAVENNQLEIVKYLIEKRREIDDVPDVAIDSMKFIKKSIMQCYTQLTEYLLSLNQNEIQLDRILINKLLSYGDDSLPIIKSLVNHGYDFTIYQDVGVVVGANIGAFELVKYFVNSGAKKDKALEESSHGHHVNIIKFLIESGADVKTNENVVIRNATKNNDLDLVKFVTSKGANLEYGLSNAIAYGHKEMMKYLISYGTEKQQKMSRNKALEISCRRESIEFIKYLLEIGGNFSTVEKLMSNYTMVLDELKEWYITFNKEKLERDLPIKLESISNKMKI